MARLPQSVAVSLAYMQNRSLAAGFEVQVAKAVEWTRESLDRGEGDFGSALCDAVAARLDSAVSARLLVPPQWRHLSALLSSTGHNIQAAELVVAEALEELHVGGHKTLVVESDYMARTDPYVDAEAAFCGDRVELWCDLENTTRAARTLRGTASYPLNGFVTPTNSSDLGLRPGVQIDPMAIAAATGAILTHVFDDEACLVLVLVVEPRD